MDSNIDDDWLGVYMVHEFNHVLQWSMDFNEPSWPIFEAVATAAQKWTLGTAGMWAGEVNTFQEIPWAPAILGDSYVIYDATGLGYYYEYGASLWVMHLDEILGQGKGMAGAELWEATANEGSVNDPDALDAFIEVSGGDLGVAMNELARTRWLVGERWDNRGLEEAQTWEADRQVPSARLELTELAVDYPVQPAPHITGQSFFELDLASHDGELRLSVASESELRSSLLLLTWLEDGTVGEMAISGFYPLLTLETAGVERAVIAVSNLGPEGFDGDDNPYQPGDQTLQLRYTPTEVGTDTAEPVEETSTEDLSEGCGCQTASASPRFMGVFYAFFVGFLRSRRNSE